MIYFSSRIEVEFLRKRYSLQFREPICTYLVSGASYSSLNNANWELTNTAGAWLSLSDLTPMPAQSLSCIYKYYNYRVLLSHRDLV